MGATSPHRAGAISRNIQFSLEITMSTIFKPNDHHIVTVELNVDSGFLHLHVQDPRTKALFDQSLPLEKYNLAIDFMNENDHIYVINMLNEMFP